MKSNPLPKPLNKPANKPYNNLLRYSNVAAQMIVIIVAGALGGKYLDAKLTLSFPAFTLAGVLLSVFAAIYISIKEFLKK